MENLLKENFKSFFHLPFAFMFMQNIISPSSNACWHFTFIAATITLKFRPEDKYSIIKTFLQQKHYRVNIKE